MLKLILIFAFQAQAAIFGADQRSYITDKSPYIDLARSTAVAVLSTNFEITSPGKIKLGMDSMEGLICSEEKFSKDPSISYACTGFLVAPDLLVTAGHCAVNVGESRHETETYCQAFQWLFDYRVDKDGKFDALNVPTENLYKCKQTVYAVREEKAPFRDFAIVQLDRPVTGRTPLKLSRQSVLTGEKLMMIGHPLGTPAKLSPWSRILMNNSERESLIATLDAFEGNSGSPVFNKKKEVVGILIGGTPSNSLIEDPKGRKCSIYNRCDLKAQNCTVPDTDTKVFPGFQATGSEVQRILSVLVELDNFQKSRAQ